MKQTCQIDFVGGCVVKCYIAVNHGCCVGSEVVAEPKGWTECTSLEAWPEDQPVCPAKVDSSKCCLIRKSNDL